MSYWSKLQQFTAVALGSCTGVGLYLHLHKHQKTAVFNSWTTNTVVSPEAKWDANWDYREPLSLLKPLKSKAKPEDENGHNEAVEAIKPKSVRHIILIRHGQYNLNGDTDAERYLTDIGRKQARLTGERLKALKVPFDRMIQSTMTRAQETAKIISTHIAHIPVETCELVAEGVPLEPSPPLPMHWRKEPHNFFQDGARIEAGFREYFHRADQNEKDDSYTLIVCHANVIRYCVCRALQIPPNAWYRLSLHHASITWITIRPSGRVTLRLLGDSGHLPLEFLTSNRMQKRPKEAKDLKG